MNKESMPIIHVRLDEFVKIIGQVIDLAQTKATKQEIMEIIDEEDVEFIRLQFTDIFGNLKNSL